MIHEFSIGGWPAVVLSDNESAGQAARMVTNWPPERLETELAAFGGTYPEITIGYNLLAVQTPRGWVLMDGGQGTLTGGQGKMLECLVEAGLSPEAISLIFLSHGHADHYGGLVDEHTGKLVFPNAEVVIGSAEWDWWTSPARLSELEVSSPPHFRAVTERLLPIAPRVHLCWPGDVIAPGMTAISTPGHTPGHLALLIEHGDDKVLYIGDAAVHPIHLKYPDTVFFNDAQPEKSPESRREILRISREQKAQILACHFAFPGFCVVPDEWPVGEA